MSRGVFIHLSVGWWSCERETHEHRRPQPHTFYPTSFDGIAGLPLLSSQQPICASSSTAYMMLSTHAASYEALFTYRILSIGPCFLEHLSCSTTFFASTNKEPNNPRLTGSNVAAKVGVCLHKMHNNKRRHIFNVEVAWSWHQFGALHQVMVLIPELPCFEPRHCYSRPLLGL